MHKLFPFLLVAEINDDSYSTPRPRCMLQRRSHAIKVCAFIVMVVTQTSNIHSMIIMVREFWRRVQHFPWHYVDRKTLERKYTHQFTTSSLKMFLLCSISWLLNFYHLTSPQCATAVLSGGFTEQNQSHWPLLWHPQGRLQLHLLVLHTHTQISLWGPQWSQQHHKWGCSRNLRGRKLSRIWRRN